MTIEREKICHELKVLERIQETPDSVSLVLEVPRTPGGKFNYRAGQFITFFMDINGQEVRRSYSLASAPEYDREFKITVKSVPGGLGSNYLIKNVAVGQKLWVTPPAGIFCLPNEVTQSKLYFYAAGSGITPIISLIKSALKQNLRTDCHLIYQNRSEDNVIFKDQLTGLVSEFRPRLNIEYVYSKPSDAWTGRKGRINSEIVSHQLTLQRPDPNSLFFVCGPHSFMEVVEAALVDAKVNQGQIRKESFTIPTHDKPASSEKNSMSDKISVQEKSSAQDKVSVQDKSSAHDNTATNNTANEVIATNVHFEIDESAVLIGDKNSKSAPNEITAIIDGQTHTLKYTRPDESILDCLLRANLNPPYSCLDGACMACIAKVKEGLVYQKDLGILSDDNVDAGECLTCQARPAAKNVCVHYETF